jgi:signal recognition particle subunit SRP54
MPGIGGLADQVDEGELGKVESMIQSMTKSERSEPKTIDKSRAKRIAKGCGRQVSDIEALVDRFGQMRQMMGMLGKQGGLLGGGGGMPSMGGGIPGMGGGMPGMGAGGFDPMAMLGGGSGKGSTKKRQDPKAKKNKRKQQQASRKKKRKK